MNVLYENIKKRRIQLNMSQQELAEAVGYSGKSMVSQVERGIIDLPRSLIMKFADALNCSESYLMGWEDEHGNDISDTSDADIRKKALSMYESYLQANPEIQSAIDTLLKVNQ